MSAVGTDSETAVAAIDPATAIGAVALTVRDADRAQEFYEEAIGLRTVERDGDTVRLGVGGEVLVELHGDPDATAPPPGTTGLFHLAILVSARPDLAAALRRLVEAGWPLAGASDHLVSEALYLGDPDGNGIEIYRDRARDQWRDEDGALRMATLPLDVGALAGELDEGRSGPGEMLDGTRIGHVHLRVADLARAEAFYAGLLGFEVMVRDYPGALFLSAGGYHHHIGLNTWAGEGAPAPPQGSTGLRWFEVVVPRRDQLDRIAERAEAAGVPVERTGTGAVAVRDPSGNALRLRTP